MAVTTWRSIDPLDALLKARGGGWIFKHSTRCPISAAAEAEFEKFAAAHPGAPVYRVLVIEDRPLSNAIAEKLAIPHPSPQAILIRDGKPIWSASHWDITEQELGAQTAAWTSHRSERS